MAEENKNGWRGDTDGTPWMQRSLISMARWIPLPVLYGVMGLVIPFYMLFDRKGFKASRSFYRKRMGYSPLHSFFMVYANEFRMGQIVLDRFYAFAGKSLEMECEGLELYDALSDRPEGFLMLSSHTGNFEMTGYLLRSAKKRTLAFAHAGETPTVTENRKRMFSRSNVELVTADDSLSYIFTLNNALADGQIVTMSGDRSEAGQRTVRCPFFGEEASFPAGPFTLAVQRQVPAIAVFTMKEGTRKYKVRIYPLDVPSEGKRDERVLALAGEYSALLEKTVREYPAQWFNFYDFWK